MHDAIKVAGINQQLCLCLNTVEHHFKRYTYVGVKSMQIYLQPEHCLTMRESMQHIYLKFFFRLKIVLKI